MSIETALTSLSDKLNSVLSLANSAFSSGETKTTIYNAVASLTAGYKKGGGTDLQGSTAAESNVLSGVIFYKKLSNVISSAAGQFSVQSLVVSASTQEQNFTIPPGASYGAFAPVTIAAAPVVALTESASSESDVVFSSSWYSPVTIKKVPVDSNYKLTALDTALTVAPNNGDAKYITSVDIPYISYSVSPTSEVQVVPVISTDVGVQKINKVTVGSIPLTSSVTKTVQDEFVVYTPNGGYLSSLSLNKVEATLSPGNSSIIADTNQYITSVSVKVQPPIESTAVATARGTYYEADSNGYISSIYIPADAPSTTEFTVSSTVDSSGKLQSVKITPTGGYNYLTTATLTAVQSAVTFSSTTKYLPAISGNNIIGYATPAVLSYTFTPTSGQLWRGNISSYNTLYNYIVCNAVPTASTDDVDKGLSSDKYYYYMTPPSGKYLEKIYIPANTYTLSEKITSNGVQSINLDTCYSSGAVTQIIRHVEVPIYVSRIVKENNDYHGWDKFSERTFRSRFIGDDDNSWENREFYVFNFTGASFSFAPKGWYARSASTGAIGDDRYTTTFLNVADYGKDKIPGAVINPGKSRGYEIAYDSSWWGKDDKYTIILVPTSSYSSNAGTWAINIF